MGMYNEVHKNCYNCGARCTIQIPQVVLGFGNFDLENPTSGSFEELTPEQKLEFKEYVEKESFYCGHDSCNSVFEVEINVPVYRGKTVISI
jgi:hypothetical protein